jgi:hypothetical protein
MHNGFAEDPVNLSAVGVDRMDPVEPVEGLLLRMTRIVAFQSRRKSSSDRLFLAGESIVGEECAGSGPDQFAHTGESGLIFWRRFRTSEANLHIAQAPENLAALVPLFWHLVWWSVTSALLFKEVSSRGCVDLGDSRS